jgi:hypothetical protein
MVISPSSYITLWVYRKQFPHICVLNWLINQVNELHRAYRVLLEKLRVAQLLKSLSVFYGTTRSTIMQTTNSLPPAPILNQMNPVYFLPAHLPGIHFNIIPHLNLG